MNAADLVEGFKAALPDAGTSEVKRQNRMALGMCLLARSRAGILRGDQGLVSGVLECILDETPTTCDRMFMWMRLKQSYPKMKIGEWVENPVTKTWLAKFDPLLQESCVNTAGVHPIWRILAEMDAPGLLEIVCAYARLSH